MFFDLSGNKKQRILLLILGGLLVLVSLYFVFKYLNSLSKEEGFFEYTPIYNGSPLTSPPFYNNNYYNADLSRYVSDNDNTLYGVTSTGVQIVYGYDNTQKGWKELYFLTPNLPSTTTVAQTVTPPNISCRNFDGSIITFKNDVAWVYHTVNTKNNLFYAKMSRTDVNEIDFTKRYEFKYIPMPKINEFNIYDKFRLLAVSNKYLFAVGCYDTTRLNVTTKTAVPGTLYYCKLNSDGVPAVLADGKPLWNILSIGEDPAGNIKSIVANDKNLYIYYYKIVDGKYNNIIKCLSLPDDNNPDDPLKNISWESNITTNINDLFFDDIYVNNYIMWLADNDTSKVGVSFYYIPLDTNGKPILAEGKTSAVIETNTVPTSTLGIANMTVFRKSLLVESTRYFKSMALYNPNYDSITFPTPTPTISTTTVPTTTKITTTTVAGGGSSEDTGDSSGDSGANDTGNIDNTAEEEANAEEEEETPVPTKAKRTKKTKASTTEEEDEYVFEEDETVSKYKKYSKSNSDSSVSKKMKDNSDSIAYKGSSMNQTCCPQSCNEKPNVFKLSDMIADNSLVGNNLYISPMGGMSRVDRVSSHGKRPSKIVSSYNPMITLDGLE